MKKSLLISLLLIATFSSFSSELTTCTSAMPTVTGINTLCGSGMATINISGSATLFWYTTSVGGLGTSIIGSAFNTPFITENTNFWLASNNGSCESERAKVMAVVLNNQLIPTITGMSTVCGSGSIQIRVRSEFLNIWYSRSSGGVSLDTTGAVFNTPSVTRKTDFWVTGYSGLTGCESARFQVTVEPIPIPFISAFSYSPNGEFGEYSIVYRQKDSLSLFFEAELVDATIVGQRFEKGPNVTVKVYMIDHGINPLITITAIAISPEGCVAPTRIIYQFGRRTPNIVTVTIPATNLDSDIEILKDYIIYPSSVKGTYYINTYEKVISVDATNMMGQKENFLPPYDQITTKMRGLVILSIQTIKGRTLKKILVE